MRTGLLTEKISIHRATTVRNDFGEKIQAYTELRTTRARVIHNSGNRETENNEVVYSYVKTFEVWHYIDIKETDLIMWGDRKYRVLSIEPVKEQNKKIVETELVNE